MRLKPHTYRRLAWVACWVNPTHISDMWAEKKPQEHELVCLNTLLRLYCAFFERHPTLEFDTGKVPGGGKNTKAWRELNEDENEEIQLLTALFPSPKSLWIFLNNFQHIFSISEIIKYCTDGSPVQETPPAKNSASPKREYVDLTYKGHLLIAMFNCFMGPARSFSPSLLDYLDRFRISWCVKGINFQSADDDSMYYLDLYHDLYSNAFPACPESPELRRREKISETKRKRNKKSADLRQAHITAIFSTLEQKKNEYSNLPHEEREQTEKPTCQRICKRYFELHEEELKKLKIHAARTLENLCSRKVSGKRPDEVRRLKNSVQAASEIDEPELYSLLKIKR